MIASPQVILSFDVETELKNFISARYGSTAASRSFSSFIESNSKGLTFCFTHNSGMANLLSLQNSWGEGSASENQTTFILELLDPMGDFEQAFLGLYAKDGSWEEALKEYFDDTIKSLQESVAVSNKMKEVLGGHQGKLKNVIQSLYKGSPLSGGRRAQPLLTTYQNAANELQEQLENTELTLPGVEKYLATVAVGKDLSMIGSLFDVSDLVDWRIRSELEPLRKALNAFELWETEYLEKTIREIGHESIIRNLDRASLSQRSQITNKLASIANRPFSKNMWISFGLGDDTGTYAPPQIVRVKNIEYSLSNGNVRQFKLHLVPIAGLSIFDEGYAVLHNYQESDRVMVSHSIPLLSTAGDSLINPFAALVRLFEEVLKSVIGNDVMSAYGDLDTSVRKRFYQFVVAYGAQTLGEPGVLTKAGMTPLKKGEDDKPVKIKETSEFLKTLLNPWAVAPRHVISDAQNKLALTDGSEITLTSLQILSFQISLYSRFFAEIGCPIEAQFDFNGVKVGTSFFDTLPPELLSYANNTTFIRDIFGKTSYHLSFKAKDKIDAKNKIKSILKRIDENNEDFHILVFPEASFAGKHPRAMIISTSIWNALLNNTMPALISTIAGGPGYNTAVNQLRNLNENWQAFHKAENSVLGTYALGDPYVPLKVDQLLLNNQGLAPANAGPFGAGPGGYVPTEEQQVVGSLETFLPGEHDSTFEGFSKKVREEKIPIFIYGPQNSNIIDFQFDLKPWMAFLANVVPRSVSSYLITKSVKAPEDKGDIAGLKKALDLWEQLATDPNVKSKLELLIQNMYQSSTKNIDAGSPAAGTLARAMALGQSWGSGDEELTTTELTVAGIDPVSLQTGNTSFQAFRVGMLSFLARYFSAAQSLPANLTFTDTYADSNWLQNILNIQSSVSQLSFEGTITTLPIFDLMSPMKLGKQALLYFVEPQMLGPEKLNNTKPYQTWLTGAYWITGYEAIIDENNIYTKFKVRKVPTR